ncbi:Protein csh3 [Cytospora mali]|uniref:Protein csh3 n=1 Tax=Cytospora mali TaxID=578113 RepID=A0A194UWG2_CYTMA|nr:Protein csh3 [Valsa mali var. pyri (nom. inval.)]
MAERQRIIETNRSLRTIKNELESLLEKGISDHSYESIHALLPSESPLSSAPTPSSTASRIASPPAPTANLAALTLNNNNNSNRNTPQPPSYAQTTGTQPPALPTRNNPQPAAPPTKPIIAHARALYAYHAADSRDCSFERDDKIAVYEYMNADWWMGRNERTGQEGIFPKTYVDVVPENNNNNNGYGEKAGYAGYGAPVQPAYGGYPPPPAGQNPYNANVPPMAVAEQGGGAAEGKHGKGQEMGKKFGKKLGNAAIFGAGATIGSNLVNSIF